MRGCPKCNGDGCEYCEYSGLDIKFAREHMPKSGDSAKQTFEDTLKELANSYKISNNFTVISCDGSTKIDIVDANGRVLVFKVNGNNVELE